MKENCCVVGDLLRCWLQNAYERSELGVLITCNQENDLKFNIIIYIYLMTLIVTADKEM